MRETVGLSAIPKYYEFLSWLKKNGYLEGSYACSEGKEGKEKQDENWEQKL